MPAPIRTVTAAFAGLLGSLLVTAAPVNAAPMAAAAEQDAPFWRQPPVILGATGLLLVLAGLLGWLWQRRRTRRPAAPPPARPPDLGGAVAAQRIRRGTVYPLPGTPKPAAARSRPPVWATVAIALGLLAGLAGGAILAATGPMGGMRATAQPTAGAWVGLSAVGQIGTPLRESAFEFTVRGLDCDGGRCRATVDVQNLTPEKQRWYAPMQRAYLPGGEWVTADEAATRAANNGRDVFAEPLAPGQRVTLPLVFSTDPAKRPSHLELRSGVFSSGVRVNVP